VSVKQIEEYRAEIDSIDRQVLGLLNHRAKMARRVGALKLHAELPLGDKRRERLILERLQKSNSGPLENSSVRRIFRVIIRESRRLQDALDNPSSSKTPRSENQGVGRS